jgi:hypothetical protein
MASRASRSPLGPIGALSCSNASSTSFQTRPCHGHPRRRPSRRRQSPTPLASSLRNPDETTLFVHLSLLFLPIACMLYVVATAISHRRCGSPHQIPHLSLTPWLPPSDLQPRRKGGSSKPLTPSDVPHPGCPHVWHGCVAFCLRENKIKRNESSMWQAGSSKLHKKKPKLERVYLSAPLTVFIMPRRPNNGIQRPVSWINPRWRRNLFYCCVLAMKWWFIKTLSTIVMVLFVIFFVALHYLML